jgi:hypothetical protein
MGFFGPDRRKFAQLYETARQTQRATQPKSNKRDKSSPHSLNVQQPPHPQIVKASVVLSFVELGADAW